MIQIKIGGLREALEFVAQHGGVTSEEVNGYGLASGYFPATGAFASASSFAKLADGSVLGIEAFTNGPLSEVTPDEDFGVNIYGFIKE